MELAVAKLKTVTLKDSHASSKDDEDPTIVILIEGKELRCSKKLLVQHSKYFSAFLAFSPAEKDLRVLELKGDCIDYESMKTIFEGLEHGSHISIDEENVQNILQASAFLQCPWSEKASADFMLANLNLSNAFSVFLLALNYGSGYLAETTEAFILSKIRSVNLVIHSIIDLLQMSLTDLKSILESIEYNEVAFHTACGWVLFDLDERSDYLEELLGDVIAEILMPEFLAVDGLEDHPWVQRALAKSVYYEALPLREKIKYWEKSESSLKRWPKLGIVCSTGNNSAIIAYRCPTSESWKKLSSKPGKLRDKSSGSTVVSANHSLYFLGGVGNEQMWSFGLKNDAWKCLSTYQDERIRPLACGVDSDVFIFGGYMDRHKEVRYFDTAVKFDTISQKWHILGSMNHCRSGGQACHAQGKIYLFGGLCSRRRVVVSCEVYDIAQDSYDHLTDLPAMILDFGLVLMGESTVYLIGGMDPLTFETKDTVYVYDLKTQEWSHDFPSLNIARKSCACFFDGKDLYVAGGATAELDQLSSVERFCYPKRRWEVVDNLPKGLAASVTATSMPMPIRLMSNYRELAQSNMSS